MDSKRQSNSNTGSLPRTAAPWAKSANVSSIPSVPMTGHTGRPVEAIIQTHPHLPQVIGSGANEPHVFKSPAPKIASEVELKQFLKSNTVKDFVGFILAANEAISGKSNTDTCHISQPIKALQEVLSTLSSWIDDIPPVNQSLRYGNPAFKQWFKKLSDSATSLCTRIVPAESVAAAEELGVYLVNSFGNATRIDYGTGHETTFCAFLYCLAALGVIRQEDLQAAITVVFTQYIELMRKVQTTYWLEPAGSHGVWGLDDYQFLAFVWGASQLVGHPSIKPSSIHAHMVLEEHWKEYLYISSIRFVKQVKKGSLQETSPLLSDISSVQQWEKVNSGLIKMYEVEVLSKLPIMQHFLFGSLLAWDT